MIKIEASQRLAAAEASTEARESEIERLYKALGFSPNQHSYENEGLQSMMTVDHGEVFLKLNAANAAKLAALLAKNKGMTISFYKDGAKVGASTAGVKVKPIRY